MSYDAQEQSRYGGAPEEFYEFTQGSTTWRWTSSDFYDDVAGHSYLPSLVSRTQLDFSAENQAGAIRVNVPRDNAVAQLFRAGLPVTPVGLTIRRRHRRSDSSTVIIFVGKVVSTVYQDEDAVMTCAPISQSFVRLLPVLTYEPQCPWALYGVGCGVDKAGFKVTGTLSAATSTVLTATAWAAKPDGWFTGGFVERATGERQFIVNHVGGVLTLFSGFGTNATVGEAVDAYAGCDRTEATCAAKFNNLVHHIGFPRIPKKNPYGGESVY